MQTPNKRAQQQEECPGAPKKRRLEEVHYRQAVLALGELENRYEQAAAKARILEARLEELMHEERRKGTCMAKIHRYDVGVDANRDGKRRAMDCGCEAPPLFCEACIWRIENEGADATCVECDKDAGGFELYSDNLRADRWHFVAPADLPKLRAFPRLAEAVHAGKSHHFWLSESPMPAEKADEADE